MSGNVSKRICLSIHKRPQPFQWQVEELSMNDINRRKETGKSSFDFVDQNMHCCKQTSLSDTSEKQLIIKQMLNRIIPEKTIHFFRHIHPCLIDIISIDLKTIKP